MCRSLKYPKSLVHYISAGRCAGIRTKTSSTYTRRILRKNPMTGLGEELQHLVLDSSIMVRIHMSHSPEPAKH